MKLTAKQLRITKRLYDVLARILEGSSNPEIAAALSVKTRTVRTYCRVLYEHFTVTSRSELIVKLYEFNLRGTAYMQQTMGPVWAEQPRANCGYLKKHLPAIVARYHAKRSQRSMLAARGHKGPEVKP